MKKTLFACIITAAAALTLATSANAAPSIGANKSALQTAAADGDVQRVHYRKWRHSHRSYYRGRNRHYRGVYGYNRRPGIFFNFGGSRNYGSGRYGNYRGNNRGYW